MKGILTSHMENKRKRGKPRNSADKMQRKRRKKSLTKPPHDMVPFQLLILKHRHTHVPSIVSPELLVASHPSSHVVMMHPCRRKKKRNERCGSVLLNHRTVLSGSLICSCYKWPTSTLPSLPTFSFSPLSPSKTPPLLTLQIFFLVALSHTRPSKNTKLARPALEKKPAEGARTRTEASGDTEKNHQVIHPALANNPGLIGKRRNYCAKNFLGSEARKGKRKRKQRKQEREKGGNKRYQIGRFPFPDCCQKNRFRMPPRDLAGSCIGQKIK